MFPDSPQRELWKAWQTPLICGTIRAATCLKIVLLFLEPVQPQKRDKQNGSDG